MSEETSFAGPALEKLKLAAEEAAWLVGRGYALEAVIALVATHHGLDARQSRAVQRGICSEPQYRRRAARELAAEDVARRPLGIDALDLVGTLAAALQGRPLLARIDGTFAHVDDPAEHGEDALAPEVVARAVTACLPVLKELRPSRAVFFLEASAPGAAAAGQAIGTAASGLRGVEVELVPSVRKALRKSPQVVTSEAEVLDSCAAWLNLAGLVLERIPTKSVLKLQ